MSTLYLGPEGVNNVIITYPATAATLTLGAGKTVTISENLSVSGTTGTGTTLVLSASPTFSGTVVASIIAADSVSSGQVYSLGGLSLFADESADLIGTLGVTITSDAVIALVGTSVTTSGPIQIGTAIELGHATDTTLSRVSEGVVAIEGVNILTQTGTQTGITNKTFVAPVLGAATGTSLALGGATLGTNALSVLGSTNYAATINGSSGGGFIYGAYSAAYGAIWSNSVTPSTANYALAAGTLNTDVNAPSGASVTLSINDVVKLTVASTGAVSIASTLAVTGATTLTGGITDATNIVFGTTTGTKLGTATTQKIAFWNATPVIQQTTGSSASTFVANTSLIANDTATFDGYTLGQVVKILRTLGILA